MNYNTRRNIVSIYDFARGYVNSKDIIVFLNVISLVILILNRGTDRGRNMINNSMRSGMIRICC